MNREIKFRGYNKKNKKWLYGYFLISRRVPFVCPDEFAVGKSWEDYQVDIETVGQYTGMHDCNDKEIYEGDVMICRALGSGRYVIRITHDGYFAYDFDNRKIELLSDMIFAGPCCEVIDNIYDNPEFADLRGRKRWRQRNEGNL